MPYVETFNTGELAESYAKIKSRIAALEVKSNNGTATPADQNFLASFHRQLRELASSLVMGKMGSGEWPADEIISRMSK